MMTHSSETSAVQLPERSPLVRPAIAVIASVMALIAATMPHARAAAQTSPPAGTPASGTAAAGQTPVTPPAGAAASDPLAGPAVRRIETASAVSKEQLGSITSVRQLSGGRLLLNDGTRRRLLLLDSSLTVIKVVLDSLTDVQNAYGTRPGALIAYGRDSTLFVDPGTYAMLVLDGDANIVRVRSVPRATDATYIANASVGNGVSSFDAHGRLVYAIPATVSFPFFRSDGDLPVMPQYPDSSFVVAIHPDTRKVDTIGAVRIPKRIYSAIRSEYGFEMRTTTSPLPLIDDWAVLSDGTVAFVRGRDYRVDYLNADGTTSSSPKLPFPWLRMDEEAKIKFVDSVKVAQVRDAQRNFATEMIVWSNLLNKPYPASFKVDSGMPVTPGLPRDWILPKGMTFPANYIFACPPTPGGAPAATEAAPATPPGAGAPAGAGGAPRCVPNNYSNWYGSGYTPPPPTYRQPTFIPASELPDYKPPLTQGSVKADADDNLWIRPMPMKPAAGGAIYDVVSRKGDLIDRIQLPPGYTLAGFGADKVVYLSMRDATGLHLARVRLR